MPLNLLVNPATINVAPWIVGGTGASALSATTIQDGSGATSLYQTVSVVANTLYTATVTLWTVSGNVGLANFVVYTTGYSALGMTSNRTLTGLPQVLIVTFNSGANTSIIFEIDYDAATTVSAVQSVTLASLAVAASLCLTGSGS